MAVLPLCVRWALYIALYIMIIMTLLRPSPADGPWWGWSPGASDAPLTSPVCMSRCRNTGTGSTPTENIQTEIIKLCRLAMESKSWQPNKCNVVIKLFSFITSTFTWPSTLQLYASLCGLVAQWSVHLEVRINTSTFNKRLQFTRTSICCQWWRCWKFPDSSDSPASWNRRNVSVQCELGSDWSADPGPGLSLVRAEWHKPVPPPGQGFHGKEGELKIVARFAEFLTYCINWYHLFLFSFL